MVCAFLAACSAATWNDTFNGSVTRTTSGGQPLPGDDAALDPDAGAAACTGIAKSRAAGPIVLTFPGHGTSSEKIHVVAGSGSCDLPIDTDTDGVAFAGDTSPCATLLAPGTPSSGTATASGTDSPSDLLFQWVYSVECEVDDDYALSKK